MQAVGGRTVLQEREEEDEVVCRGSICRAEMVVVVYGSPRRIVTRDFDTAGGGDQRCTRDPAMH